MIKIIIGGSHRSGTGLLTSSLSNLPQSRNIGELFQISNVPEHILKWRSDFLHLLFGVSQFPNLVPGPLKYGTLIVDQKDTIKVYNRVDQQFPHADFLILKILFQQCPYTSPIWDIISDDPNVRVIFLKRNPIDILVSLAHAIKTKQWYVSSKSEDEPKTVSKVTVAKRNLTDFLLFIETHYAFVDLLCSKFPGRFMQVNYSDLVSNWNTLIIQICKKIGVKPIALQQKSKQQITTKHIDMISNIDELRQHLKNTQFAHYLQ
jgi:LPS sulfotransferase NodH